MLLRILAGLYSLPLLRELGREIRTLDGTQMIQAGR
jgi:hypothetical protein